MAAPQMINGQPFRYFATPPTWNEGEGGAALVDNKGRLQLAVGALATGQTYTVTNATPTRTLNAATATTGDVANVVAALITDLKSIGIIS